VGGPGEGGKQDPTGRGAAKIADLPPRLRERVTQAPSEGFPPGYEKLLEEFYLRLSRGNAAGETTPPKPPPPTDKPASAPSDPK
jgi:hypothetical protein